MKKILFTLMALYGFFSTAAQMTCNSSNCVYYFDTTLYSLTRHHIVSNHMDTILFSESEVYIDLFCNDTLVVFLGKSANERDYNFFISSLKYRDNDWDINYGFNYTRDDWAEAGAIWPNTIYVRTSDFKMLAINLFQWRETSMKGDRTGKEVWEYVEQLDFNNGKKVRVSSTRIE